MLKKKDIWERITTSLESDISQSEFKTWFSNITLKKLEPALAVIEVPNKFIASWLVDNYIHKIQNSFKSVLDSLPEIRFTYSGPPTGQDSPAYLRVQEPRSGLSHGLNSLMTFGNFITTNSNRFAYSSALDVANRPATYYNPLYIFSNLSLGKTHLLHAIGNHLLAKDPIANVRYISVDQFTSDFSLASKNRKLDQFRESYRNLDLLLLDNIHTLSGREKTQQELISLFNSFYESKKQVVVAGNMPPGQIQNLLPQLKSRLEWGLISEIQTHDQKAKMQIIKKKAEERNLHLPDDVTFFLAKNSNDLKTLVQYLVSVQTYISLYQREIDLSTVKSIIKNRYYYNISVRDIQKITAEHFGLSLSDILSDERKRRFSYPRQVAMYLSRKLTDLSFKEIGKAFGNKDHSTVIYAVKRIKRDKDLKKAVLDDINKLQNLIS